MSIDVSHHFDTCFTVSFFSRSNRVIVAEAPDGSIAAFCTLWYDHATQTGYFEPAGTVPEHQKLGLGKAVMIEAMLRLKAMNDLVAMVAGFSPAANALYASVVSPLEYLLEPWLREWKP